jgi:hypothetical protein
MGANTASHRSVAPRRAFWLHKGSSFWFAGTILSSPEQGQSKGRFQRR